MQAKLLEIAQYWKSTGPHVWPGPSLGVKMSCELPVTAEVTVATFVVWTVVSTEM